VMKNAVATYLVEMLLHTIKETETGQDLYEITQQALLYIDRHELKEILNIPLVFSLQLASLLGFRFQGKYSEATPVLDLAQGSYVSEVPDHGLFIEGEPARLNGILMRVTDLATAKEVPVTNNNRRSLLKCYQQFFI